MFLQWRECSANSKGILTCDAIFLWGLRACANTNAFYDGLAIHAQIVEEGFDGHTLVEEMHSWIINYPYLAK